MKQAEALFRGILNVLPFELLISFFGGLFAVLLAIILKEYRKDLDNVREIKRTLKFIQEYAEENLSQSRKDQNRKQIPKELEKLYVEYDYLLTEYGSIQIRLAIKYFDRHIGERDKRLIEETLDMDISTFSKLALSEISQTPEEQIIRDVTFRGAIKRFFGFDGAYSLTNEPDMKIDPKKISRENEDD